jgi:hypothetical protein
LPPHFKQRWRSRPYERFSNRKHGFFLVYLNSFNEWHEGHQFEPMQNGDALSDAQRARSYTQSCGRRLSTQEAGRIADDHRVMGHPELTMSAWLRFGHIRARPRRVSPSPRLGIRRRRRAFGAWLAAVTTMSASSRMKHHRRWRLAGCTAAGRGLVVRSLASDSPPVDVVCAFEVLEHIRMMPLP